MSRPEPFKFSLRGFAASAALAGLVSCCSANMLAAGLNFVEASDLTNLTPASAINGAGVGTADDNLWGYRTTFGTGGAVYESKASGTLFENSPTLTQRVSGLTPGTSYDFYAVFWTDKDSNWAIKAGISPGAMTTTSYAGNTGYYPVPGSQQAITAGAALWDALPLANDDGLIFTERPGVDSLIMLLGKAGAAVANASGEVDVYIDDLDELSGNNNRSWFDGIAYVAAGGLSSLTASVNRDTGALTLANPTNTAFQINSISIASDSGALNAPNWTPISGNRDGVGNSSFDSDAWVVTAPADIPSSLYATALAEAEVAPNNGVGGILAANGGSISFGNVWHKSFFEDIRIELTLADGTLVAMRPTYTGVGYVAGDFNRDGALNLADYQILVANINSTIPAGLSRVQTNALGDYTGGGLVDFDDFTLFRAAYDVANGAGAFAAMVASVPEPGSLGLLMTGALLLVRRSRRRAVQAAGAAAVTCGLAASAEAAPLLAVDVNARTGDAVDNTVAGFTEFKLPAGSPVQIASATIGSFGITMKSVNASGASAGALDDRDRAAPTGTPTLNQLDDDFIFVPAAGVGAGGGMDLSIASGGALQPNKSYQVSIFTYDVTSTGTTDLRTTNWLDGNSFNANVMSTAFTGSTAPTTDERYKFSGVYRTDASGNLLLKGRSASPAGTNAVFVNGFTIEEVAPALTLEVNLTTGATRIVNEYATTFDISYYAIRSASGALNPTNWTSFDDGEGVDAFGSGWDEAVSSSATLLNELNLTSQTSFAQNASLSLGNGFTPGGTTDVRFAYAAPGGGLMNGIVTYVQSAPSMPGDFDGNGFVNAADLEQWKGDYGVNDDSDADDDNDTDGADFLIWQRNLGQGAAAPLAAAVPEPAGIALGWLALGGLAASRRRRA